MNYFFALELPDKARAQIADFASRWEQQIDPSFHAKWYPPDDYHITLKFLGDISEALIPDTKTAAEEIARQVSPFVISQKPLVTFPAKTKPHVLWVEVVPNDWLKFIEFGLKYPLWHLGIKPDFRDFKPHITLARCQPDMDVPPFVLGERAFDDFMADHFVLMQTLPPEQRAKETKSRYNIVQTFPFGNTQL